LSVQCLSHQLAAAAGAAGGHSAAGALLCEQICSTDEEADRTNSERDHGGAYWLQLAGQYPRTAESDREGSDPDPRARVGDTARRVEAIGQAGHRASGSFIKS